MNALTTHGGPDGGLPVKWDFSSNANVCVQPDRLIRALAETDRHVYPDPHYTCLRTALGEATGCSPDLIVPTSGSSEGIRRLTLAAMQSGVREVWVPQPSYGDYEAAATALGLTVRKWHDVGKVFAELAGRANAVPVLWWFCEPCNPTGASLPADFWLELEPWLAGCVTVAIDRAYEPLRLHGHNPVPAHVAAECWQLFSPNKSCGLTGVRAGWMQAPRAAARAQTPNVSQVNRLAPSWVLSAEGVTLLTHWHSREIQDWLNTTRRQLAQWQVLQRQALTERGWIHQTGSVTPFMLSRPPLRAAYPLPAWLAVLREQGIKLRDASSFGLPGWVRWRVHEPQAAYALCQALDKMAVMT